MSRMTGLVLALIASATTQAQPSTPPSVRVATDAAGLAAPGGARRFTYEDGAVFAVVAQPGRITDIVLEPGEVLSGPVAAGDTARWVIGDTASGAGAGRRVHVLIKPTLPTLATNLIITTDRRTYHLDLRASARTWLSQVSWRYIDDAAPTLSRAPALALGAEGAAGRPLNLAYRIEGPYPPWRPTRVFDDGRRVYVEFGQAIEMSDLPPLYRLGDGKSAELINYRVEDGRLVVDRLFDRAQLRLGTGRRAQAVTLSRTTPVQAVAR